MSAKYELIDAEKASYPLVKLCAWLGVSRSGFYEWRGRPDSATATRRKRLTAYIRAAFEASDATYGYRRVHAQLARWGIAASAELVRAIMRAQDLQPCQPRPWRPVTTLAGDAEQIPDLLGRHFTATEPGTKLVGDITYIPTWEGFVYLATVIDLCTKECIGYAIADHLRTELVTDALDMAAGNGRLGEDGIFHSDRGCQYASAQFAEHAKKLGLRRSVGRTGVCWDNAAAESFNAAVKVERVNRTVYPTREHARKDVTRYIEFRYNTRRLHSALGYRTPYEAYTDHINTRPAA